MTWICTLFKLYYVPCLLVTVILFGILVPGPGTYAASVRFGEGICVETSNHSATCVWDRISTVNVSLIFFLAGVQLKTSDIRSAANSKLQLGLGILMILVVTSGCCYLIIPNLPLERDFCIGMGIMAMMPTSLTACVLITDQAKGNVALTLSLSVLTNILGILLIPVKLSWFLSLYTVDEATIVDRDRTLQFGISLGIMGGLSRVELTSWIGSDDTSSATSPDDWKGIPKPFIGCNICR